MRGRNEEGTPGGTLPPRDKETGGRVGTLHLYSRNLASRTAFDLRRESNPKRNIMDLSGRVTRIRVASRVSNNSRGNLERRERIARKLWKNSRRISVNEDRIRIRRENQGERKKERIVIKGDCSPVLDALFEERSGGKGRNKVGTKGATR